MPKWSNLWSPLTVKTTTSFASPQKGKAPDLCTRSPDNEGAYYTFKETSQKLHNLTSRNSGKEQMCSTVLLLQYIINISVSKVNQFLKMLFHTENDYLFFVVQWRGKSRTWSRTHNTCRVLFFLSFFGSSNLCKRTVTTSFSKT